MGWLTTKRIAEPATQPVTTAECRGVMKTPSDLTDENARFDEWIEAEVGRCERVSGRALITQTLRLTLDSFCDCKNGAEFDCHLGQWVINLPAPPLIAVSGTDAASPTPNALGISYVDADGATQSLTVATDFLVDTGREPGRITLAYGKVWPTTRNQAGAVTITFTAGYGAASAVPAEVKSAIRQAVAYRALSREEPDEAFLDRIFARFDYGRLP